MFHGAAARRALCAIAGVLVSTHTARAQANIPQIRGDFGILSGSLLPGGWHAGFLYGNYQVDHVIATNETAMPSTMPTVSPASMLLAVSYPASILGGHWSSTVQIPWADFVIATPTVSGNSSW